MREVWQESCRFWEGMLLRFMHCVGWYEPTQRFVYWLDDRLRGLR